MTIRNMLPRLWGDDTHPLRAFRQDMDSLFDAWTRDLGFPQVSWSMTQVWPRVNVSETDKDVQITAELPGVDQKDIDISVKGGDITIKGEKKSEVDEKKDDKGRAYHRVERSFGSFERRLSLPFDVDPAKVQASFKDGVLTLSLPKPVEAQKAVKKIEIKSDKQVEAKKAA